MALRPIITLPDPKLRMRSEPFAKVDGATRSLLDDMIETMYDAPGIGLAAVQIGVLQRAIVLDTAGKEEAPRPLFMVNPEIVSASSEPIVYEEGCLSIPDYYEEVERSDKVRVRFLDRDGAECEVEADGLLAIALQHEIDHLNGVLFIDHISRLKRERVVRKFEKAARRAEEDGKPLAGREGGAKPRERKPPHPPEPTV